MHSHPAGSLNFYIGYFRCEMKRFSFILITFLLISSYAYSQRIKDIAYFSNDNSVQVLGYGLVVGLAGTGDNSNRTPFTPQSITSMLKRLGITVPQADLKTKNVAAVMVTATLSRSLKAGAQFDVNISSLGDATSLQGGTLLMTPLSSAYSDRVLAIAQGSLSVGGFDISTSSGSRVAKNHTAAGRLPKGGILNEALGEPDTLLEEISLYLRDPDLTTANNITAAINAKYGAGSAKSLDASEVRLKVPQDKQTDFVPFMAELESIQVVVDYKAKVVLNERTGTVVAGNNVKIYPVTISQGNLNISVKSFPIISQPGAFSNGTTQVFNNLLPTVTQDTAHVVALQQASNVQEVAAALNSLKVSPRDIITIFQALKEAGALVAELVIM